MAGRSPTAPLGFMLGGRYLSLFGPDTEHAFGHLGFTNIVTWADPEREIAVALMTSGKPMLYPQLYSAFDVLLQIGRACEKKTGKKNLPSRGRGTS